MSVGDLLLQVWLFKFEAPYVTGFEQTWKTHIFTSAVFLDGSCLVLVRPASHLMLLAHTNTKTRAYVAVLYSLLHCVTNQAQNVSLWLQPAFYSDILKNLHSDGIKQTSNMRHITKMKQQYLYLITTDSW